MRAVAETPLKAQPGSTPSVGRKTGRAGARGRRGRPCGHWKHSTWP